MLQGKDKNLAKISVRFMCGVKLRFNEIFFINLQRFPRKWKLSGRRVTIL